MNIPSLVKLQKESGGPTNFMNKEDIEKHSKFHRSPGSTVSLKKEEVNYSPVSAVEKETFTL